MFFLNMAAKILDGKYVASTLKRTLRETLAKQMAQGHRAPCLAVILIGHDKASEIYVKNKKQACIDIGITSQAFHLPDETEETTLITLIHELNHSEAVDGILVQLPLPPHISTPRILGSIAPQKDVDGFHPENLGRLAQNNPFLRPCTPKGIMHLLAFYEIAVAGMHCVIVGASNIVGKPMALELLNQKATVTVCHSRTRSLPSFIKHADLVVSATGVTDIIQPQWLNRNQVVIDVGIHRLPNGRLRGDICFEKAVEKVAWITPVPGGIGPMTIVSLLENTVLAASN